MQIPPTPKQSQNFQSTLIPEHTSTTKRDVISQQVLGQDPLLDS